ncbi:MAG: hypothetical protein IJK26_11080 [Clostridia bacterium]|nr:hypothetical protein [Clostridia bacterium]
MRKYTVAAVLLIICVLFTACSVQPDADIYEFSERLFRVLDEKPYEPSDYYFDGSERFSYFLSINRSRTAVITLSTEENMAVRSFEITLTKANVPLSADEQQYIYGLFMCACSVLSQRSVEDIKGTLESNAFTAESIDFTEFGNSFSSERLNFFFRSNSEIISLYTEII